MSILRDFTDGLDISHALLVGYDWGGRAACVAGALWPGRVRGLVSVNGYNIQHIPGAGRPGSAAQEHRYWHQWYFHTERGRLGLEQNRRNLARLLWQLWSPNWRFSAETLDSTAASFDNPDFVAGQTGSDLSGRTAGRQRLPRSQRALPLASGRGFDASFTSEGINGPYSGRTTSPPLTWGNDRIGIGLLKALRARTRIVFEDHPSPVENVPSKSAHLVVCEDGDELSQVIAANYAAPSRLVGKPSS